MREGGRVAGPDISKEGKPMLLIIGTIRLPPNRFEEARPVMERMISGSRAEDGCLE